MTDTQLCLVVGMAGLTGLLVPRSGFLFVLMYAIAKYNGWVP
jgi:hypothetical protein